jgi:hypothetical protein
MRFTAPFRLEARVKTTTDATNGFVAVGTFLGTSNGVGILSHPTLDYYRNDSSWTSLGSNYIATGSYFRLNVIPTSSTSVTIEIRNDANALQATTNITNTVSAEPILIGQRYDNLNTGQSYEAYWDFIRVRKYASTDPTLTSTASEETKPDPVQEYRYGFAISKPGHDVETTEPSNLGITSAFDSLRVFHTGRLSVTFPPGNYNNAGAAPVYSKEDVWYFDPPLGYEPVVTPPEMGLFGTATPCGPSGFIGACSFAPQVFVDKQKIRLRVSYIGGDGLFGICTLSSPFTIVYDYTVFRNRRDEQFNLIEGNLFSYLD